MWLHLKRRSQNSYMFTLAVKGVIYNQEKIYLGLENRRPSTEGRYWGFDCIYQSVNDNYNKYNIGSCWYHYIDAVGVSVCTTVIKLHSNSSCGAAIDSIVFERCHAIANYVIFWLNGLSVIHLVLAYCQSTQKVPTKSQKSAIIKRL